jgi:hypothetical protein
MSLLVNMRIPHTIFSLTAGLQLMCFGPGVAGCEKKQQVDIPSFTALSTELQSFETVSVALEFNPYPSASTSGMERAILHASPVGPQVSVQTIDGQRVKYSWTEGEAHRHLHGWNQVERIGAADEYLRDVWPELRSGFRNSAVYREDPRSYGLPFQSGPRSTWLRIELPFHWAEQLSVFLLMSDTEAELRKVVVLGDEAIHVFAVHQVDWNIDVPTDAFFPEAAADALPRPACWQVQAVD